MILAECLFTDLDRPPIKRLGLSVARKSLVGDREVVQCRGSFHIVGTKLGRDEMLMSLR